VSSDPAEILAKAIESARNVKFGRGVVGKTGHVVLGLVAMWLVICLRLGENWMLDAGLIAAGLIGTALGVWWISAIKRFAERNPALALLEGAELVEYHRLEVTAQGGVKQIPGDDDTPRLLRSSGEGQ
jgi:hypothetical protein